MAETTPKSYSADPTLYLYTSLTAGSSHIITATSRLETILKANKIPFRALDVATDEKARMLWGRRSKGKKLPGLVKFGSIVGVGLYLHTESSRYANGGLIGSRTDRRVERVWRAEATDRRNTGCQRYSYHLRYQHTFQSTIFCLHVLGTHSSAISKVRAHTNRRTGRGPPENKCECAKGGYTPYYGNAKSWCRSSSKGRPEESLEAGITILRQSHVARCSNTVNRN